MKTSDFLVIGAGVAGLSFALRAAEHGKVAVITKGKFPGLQFRQGAGRHRRRMGTATIPLKTMLRIRWTPERASATNRPCALSWRKARTLSGNCWNGGVNFDPGNQGEDYELAREGGHTKRRILHAKDATGLEITSKLLEAAKLHPNIELLEDHFAIDLITTTKLGLVTEDRVLGAYVLDRVSGEVEIFRVRPRAARHRRLRARISVHYQ